MFKIISGSTGPAHESVINQLVDICLKKGTPPEGVSQFRADAARFMARGGKIHIVPDRGAPGRRHSIRIPEKSSIFPVCVHGVARSRLVGLAAVQVISQMNLEDAIVVTPHGGLGGADIGPDPYHPGKKLEFYKMFDWHAAVKATVALAGRNSDRFGDDIVPPGTDGKTAEITQRKPGDFEKHAKTAKGHFDLHYYGPLKDTTRQGIFLAFQQAPSRIVHRILEAVDPDTDLSHVTIKVFPDEDLVYKTVEKSGLDPRSPEAYDLALPTAKAVRDEFIDLFDVG